MAARIAVGLVLAVGICRRDFVRDRSGTGHLYFEAGLRPRAGVSTNGIAAGILSAIREFHIKLFAVVIAVSAGALVLRMILRENADAGAGARRLAHSADLSGWAGDCRQCGVQGELVAAASGACDRIRRRARNSSRGGIRAATCPKNCSFVSGEASAGFAVLAIAVLAPAAWRLPAIALALGFGVFVGVLRVAAGGHFTSDVVFAGVLTALGGVAAARTDLSLAARPASAKARPSSASMRLDAVLARHGMVDPLARLFSNIRSLRPRDSKARDVRQLDEQPSG